MAKVRASEVEAGQITVGGADMLCFMTSWGDGLFPVHADYGAAGGLVGVRIVLGDEQRRARMEDMFDRWAKR
jgi:hypothetical protein